MDDFPFLKIHTVRPTNLGRRFMLSVEEHGLTLRKEAGVSELQRLDPAALAAKLGVKLTRLDELPSLPSAVLARLSNVDVRAWSGIGIPLPDGQLVIVLHPKQTKERAAITAMEEIAHAYYGHRPTQLIPLPGGLLKREYNADLEREAYFTGAAALLPSEAVGKAVWFRHSPEGVAQRYGVSLELVEFRIKTLGLWSDYKAG